MDELHAVLSGDVKPGVYRWRGRAAPVAVCTLAAEHSFRCFYLDGRLIEDKASFLRACDTALGFPAYVGRNWDALDEALTDLSWSRGSRYLLLYDHVTHFARSAPDQWAIALDVLRSTVDYWRSTATPMYVLLRNTRGAVPDIPALE